VRMGQFLAGPLKAGLARLASMHDETPTFARRISFFPSLPDLVTNSSLCRITSSVSGRLVERSAILSPTLF